MSEAPLWVFPYESCEIFNITFQDGTPAVVVSGYLRTGL